MRLTNGLLLVYAVWLNNLSVLMKIFFSKLVFNFWLLIFKETTFFLQKFFFYNVASGSVLNQSTPTLSSSSDEGKAHVWRECNYWDWGDQLRRWWEAGVETPPQQWRQETDAVLAADRAWGKRSFSPPLSVRACTAHKQGAVCKRIEFIIQTSKKTDYTTHSLFRCLHAV